MNSDLTLEYFFKKYYIKMCGRCYLLSGYKFNKADIEEEVSSAIEREFEKVKNICLKRFDENYIEIKIFYWLSKAAFYRTINRYRDFYNSNREEYDEIIEERLICLDDPEQILDLKQRIPIIPNILIQYESYKNEKKLTKECKKFNFEKQLFLARLSK